MRQSVYITKSGEFLKTYINESRDVIFVGSNDTGRVSISIKEMGYNDFVFEIEDKEGSKIYTVELEEAFVIASRMYIGRRMYPRDYLKKQIRNCSWV